MLSSQSNSKGSQFANPYTTKTYKLSLTPLFDTLPSGKTKADFGHGDARFIPYTNVFENPIIDENELGSVEIDNKQNQVVHGDVFFTVSSETPEEVGMTSVWLGELGNLYLNSFCFGYRQNGSFDDYYLAYMLRSAAFRKNITLLAQGISRFNISKNKVMDLTVSLPCAEEQRQIGAYFKNLDSLITLHQRKHLTVDLRECRERAHDNIYILVL